MKTMLTEKEIRDIKNTPDKLLLSRFVNYTRQFLRDVKNDCLKTPKILFIDIETAPIEAYLWGIWEQNVSLEQIINDWFVLCVSAKWFHANKVISFRLTGKEALKKDDKRILKEIWELLDEADIVIAHNGDKFDIKKINARFLKYGIEYPSAYKTMDTLKIARKEFSLTSNKLDYICRFLGIPGKVDTGGQRLWNACVHGDDKSLKKMSKYCDNDINILEQVYIKLLPYIRSNPRSWNVRIGSKLS